MARKQVTLRLGGYLTSVTLIVAIVEALMRADLMYGLAIVFEGVIMSLSLILAIIPIVNLYVLFGIKDFVAGMFISWGLEVGVGSAVVFALGFISVFVVTLVVDIIVAVVVYNYLIGNKRQASVMMNKIAKMFSM